MSDPVHAMSPQQAAAKMMFQLATGHFAASALQCVAQLRVADHLAGGPQTTSALAAQLSVSEDALYRVMRALASVGVFDEVAPRQFALTPAGSMLRSGVPGSMHPMALWITSPFHFRVYAELIHAVRDGKPAAERVTQMPVFEYLAHTPELSEIFNNAMTSFSEMVVPAVLESYDFSGIAVLVDVAGGHGALLSTILQRYPGMKGVLFDLDHVVAGARPRLQALGLGDRLRIDSGDFFSAVPAGDAFIMKHIIHDWDDERSLKILGNIRKAMGEKKGKVLLVESVLPPGNTPDLGKLIDLEMLMMTGGKERTADEFAKLFADAGFRMTRVVQTGAPLNVIEAVRE